MQKNKNNEEIEDWSLRRAKTQMNDFCSRVLRNIYSKDERESEQDRRQTTKKSDRGKQRESERER